MYSDKDGDGILALRRTLAVTGNEGDCVVLIQTLAIDNVNL